MITQEKLLSEEELWLTRKPSGTATTITKNSPPRRPMVTKSTWVQKQLAPIEQIEDNWDGYKGEAPQIKAVLMAAELLSEVERTFGYCAPVISPTRRGGVLLNWTRQNRELEVQLNPDESFSFVYEEGGEVCVSKSVPASTDDYSFNLSVQRFFR